MEGHELTWLFETQKMEVFCGNHVTVKIERENLSSCQPELQVRFKLHGCHQKGCRVKRSTACPEG